MNLQYSRTSRSRESSPSLGGGWAALGAKSEKPKKEKKLQQFDLFAPSDPADNTVSKKKKEVFTDKKTPF